MMVAFFTWSNDKKGPTMSRLDRIIMSIEVELFYPSLHLKTLPRVISDNVSFVLDFGITQVQVC